MQRPGYKGIQGNKKNTWFLECRIPRWEWYREGAARAGWDKTGEVAVRQPSGLWRGGGRELPGAFGQGESAGYYFLLLLPLVFKVTK